MQTIAFETHDAGLQSSDGLECPAGTSCGGNGTLNVCGCLFQGRSKFEKQHIVFGCALHSSSHLN